MEMQIVEHDNLKEYNGGVFCTHLLTHIVLDCSNYVVQYILDLKTAWSSTEVMARLEGNYAFLSMQKFSSNVVEKCLKLGVEEPRSRLVRELMTSPHLGQLLQDQYANYVIQSALSVCKVLTLSADSKALFDSTVLHHNLL